MQRVRLALPYLLALGWEPTVLAVAPESVEGAVMDEILLHTYPADIRVLRVRGVPPHLTRWAGIGSLWWRCSRALRATGDRLLKAESFDLVFFSTTQFDAFTLGPRWLRRFGVPYVLDYQDPWINNYYHNTGTRPPGGPLKFWFSQFNARRLEPAVVKSAAAIIAVSPSYGVDLHRRYPWFPAENVRTIPFGTSFLDLRIAREHNPGTSLVPFGDGNFHHIYAGRCGPDMTIALTALFRAFKHYLLTHPTEAARHRFHFIGTDYAPPPFGQYWVLPVAEREGVAPQVSEHCYRVSYFDALYYITRADVLIVVGSNDPTYSPSKIYPYLFAQRPLITIAHENSLMIPVAQAQCPLSCYAFSSHSDLAAISDRIYREWFIGGLHQHTPICPVSIIKGHGAETMAGQLAEVFELAARRTSRPISD
jgi:hypothetical protein